MACGALFPMRAIAASLLSLMLLEMPAAAQTADGWLAQARRHAQARQWTQASEAARKAIALDRGLGKPEFYASLAARGDFAAAIPLMEAVRSNAPPSYDLDYNLALACFMSGNLDKAAGYAAALTGRSPKAEAFNLLAEIEEKRGRYLEAVRAFQKAAELEPANEDYRFDYGYELLRHKNTGEAAAIFAGGVTDFPGSWRMRLALGCAWYIHGGAALEAVQPLLEALSIQPRIVLAYRILGQMYEFAGAEQPAIRAAFSRYLSSQPRDAWAYYYQGRIQYLDAHSAASPDYGPAAATLKKALTLKPDLAGAHLQLGVIALDEERPKDSLERLLTAIRLNPHLAEAHYRLGVAYNRLGDTERAVAQFELHEKVKAEAQKDADNEEVMQFLVSQNPEASLAR